MAINWKSMYIFYFKFVTTISAFQEYYKISDARIIDGNGTLKQIKERALTTFEILLLCSILLSPSLESGVYTFKPEGAVDPSSHLKI